MTKTIRKALAFILTLAFITGISTTAFASQGIQVTIDGTQVQFYGTQPQIVLGVVQTPTF